MVATPIGNLADLSLRALHVLQQVDWVACEDTRHTAQLLSSVGLHKPLLALHQHNENEAAQTVIGHLQQGLRVAYVSDAGTPGVSDPGARLCTAVAAAGFRRMPLPGASSVTALISVAGLDNAPSGSAFAFAGFLPSKSQARQQALDALAQSHTPTVVLEAPHRIVALATEMAAHAQLASRTVTVGRELTKQFESVYTLCVADWPAYLQASPQNIKGEFALVLHGLATQTSTQNLSPLAQQLLDALLPELPLKKAVQLTVQISGEAKNAVYEAALARKSAD